MINRILFRVRAATWRHVLSAVLALLLILPLGIPARSAHVSSAEAADTLKALGLLKGTENGLELDRGATRAESVVMLLRLLGKETTAQNEKDACPFRDGGWASSYLTYAWKNGLVKGQETDWFGSQTAVAVRDYLTMVLRVLGYSDANGEFSWAGSIAFSDSIGLTHGEYTAADYALREDLALISYTALTMKPKGAGHTLIEQLYLDGTVSAASLKATRLVSALTAGKTTYSAQEIYERTSSAVFYLEMFRNEESIQKDKPDAQGSGFFVTSDGVALMCYHELDGMTYARATTTDGRVFDITGVLKYDPFWDLAAVRVSRTDHDGNTVRFFPYLDLGDSDSVFSGETVYTVSNPLGLADTISDGIISNCRRNVDDPDYLCIQYSVPISSGSSGGPLLNRFGEVVGIIFATYINGQNLNLAVPINSAADYYFTGDGTELAEVKETERVKKAAAVITVPETEIELEYRETRKIMVTHTYPETTSVQYEIKTTGPVICEWGSFVTKHSVPLSITAMENGETDIDISFADQNEEDGVEFKLTLHVTVTGAPEETDAEETNTEANEA